MHRFTDTTGRDWIVEITCTAAKRVRAITSFDPLNVAGDALQRLWSDPVLVADVLYAACRPQAEERGVSQEAFGDALAGDALGQAREALIDAIVSFTPHPRERAVLARVVMDARQQMDAARTRLEATSGPSSGGAPESSASTPDP